MKGLLQKQVALDLNIPIGTFCLYEQGRREPDYATLKKIANYYNVSVDYLLDNENISNTSENKVLEYNIKKQLLVELGFINNTNDDVSQKDLNNLIKFIKANKELIKNQK